MEQGAQTSEGVGRQGRVNKSVNCKSLVATTNAGSVVLSWTASPETNALYHVYRSTNGLDGAFTNLTATAPIASGNFTDTSPPSGQKTYSVRAVKLTITGSGSYTNLSQGIFATTN